MTETNNRDCTICLDNTDKFQMCTNCNKEFCIECSKKMGKCPMCRSIYNQAFVNEEERLYRLEQDALSEQYIQSLIEELSQAPPIIYTLQHQGVLYMIFADGGAPAELPPAQNYRIIDGINLLYNNEITPENFNEVVKTLPNITENHKNLLEEYTTFYIDGNITRDEYITYSREMLNEYII